MQHLGNTPNWGSSICSTGPNTNAADDLVTKGVRAYAAMIWNYPDSKVHTANMGPIWDRQDPGGPHVCPMNFAIWVVLP